MARPPFVSITERVMIQKLQERGVEMFLMPSSQSPEIEEMGRRGVKIFNLHLEKKLDREGRALLRSIIVDNDIQIVHVTYSMALRNVLRATKGLDVKIIAFYGSLSLHWHDLSSYSSFLNRRVDKIICISDSVAEHVKRQMPSRCRDKVVRIYRGYDTDWFSGITPINRKSLNIADDEFIVCSVANLRWIKGVRFLIRSVNYIPDEVKLKILLVGLKTNSARIKRMVNRTRRPDMFMFIGPVNFAPEYALASDLYVQPSISEGLGRAIIESMCMAKPVVVTDGGGAKEMIDEGVNGFVVRHSSAKAIAECIVRCYELRDSLPEIGKRAQESIEKNINSETTVDQTYIVYEKLLSE